MKHVCPFVFQPMESSDKTYVQEIKCMRKEICNFIIVYLVFCDGGVKGFSLHFVLLDSRVPAILGKAEINHFLIGTPVPM